MKAAAVGASMVLASSLMAGCTAEAPRGQRPADPAGEVLTSGSELGDGRPKVSHEG